MQDTIQKLLSVALFELSLEDKREVVEIEASYTSIFEHNQKLILEFKTRIAQDIDPKAYAFSFKMALEKCEELQWREKKYFYSELKIYFLGKYKLDNDFFNDLDQKFEPISKTPEKLVSGFVIQFLEKKLAGKSLSQSGFENLVRLIKNKVYRKQNVSVNKNRLTFENFVSYSHWMSSGTQIDYRDTGMSLLIQMFSYFLKNELCTDPRFSSIPNSANTHHVKLDFSIPYFLPAGLKVSRLRFYKNRRLDIYFESETLTAQFVYLFTLNSDFPKD